MRQLQQAILENPWSFIRTFAQPGKDGLAFSTFGLVQHIHSLGYTDDDLDDAMQAILGFRLDVQGTLQADELSRQSMAKTTKTDASGTENPPTTNKIPMKAPPGLYRITKLGDKTEENNQRLGTFAIRSISTSWDGRRLERGKETLDAKIFYTDKDEKDCKIDPHLVWRLATVESSADNNLRTVYRLGFWQDVSDDGTVTTRFAGTIQESSPLSQGMGSDRKDIEGVLDDDINATGLGGFLGSALDQEARRILSQSGDGSDESPPWVQPVTNTAAEILFVVLASCLGGGGLTILVYLFIRATRQLPAAVRQRIYPEDQDLGPDPVVQPNPGAFDRLQPLFSDVDDADGGIWPRTRAREIRDEYLADAANEISPLDDVQKEMIKKLDADKVVEEAPKEKGSIQFTCKPSLSRRKKDDEHDNDNAGFEGSPNGDNSPNQKFSVSKEHVALIVSKTTKAAQEVKQAMLAPFISQLEIKAKALIEASFTKLDTISQAVLPADNPCIEWLVIVPRAIEIATPAKDQPPRSTFAIRKAFLQALIPYVLQACLPDLLALGSRWKQDKLLQWRLEQYAWPNFIGDVAQHVVFRVMAMPHIQQSLASETVRIAAVKEQDPTARTIVDTDDPSISPEQRLRLFKTQSDVLQLAQAALEKEQKTLAAIRAKLESGTLTKQNAEQVMRDQMMMMRDVKTGLWVPIAPRNDADRLSEYLMTVSAMFYVAKGQSGNWNTWRSGAGAPNRGLPGVERGQGQPVKPGKSLNESWELDSRRTRGNSSVSLIFD